VSYSHNSHIQLYSIFDRINASGLSVPWVLFVQVLMSVQHTPVGSCFSLWVVWDHHTSHSIQCGLVCCCCCGCLVLDLVDNSSSSLPHWDTFFCIVALLATFIARHVLMLLHRTLLVRLSIFFICHMNSLVIDVVWQHCHGTLYCLWVVSTFHTFWYPLLQKKAGSKLVSWRFLICFIGCCRRWHWGPPLGFSHINTWCKSSVVFS
jgi:hypothetical protein